MIATGISTENSNLLYEIHVLLVIELEIHKFKQENMIVWSGRGFLFVLVLIIVLMASISLLPKEFGDYAFVIAAFTTGIFSWFFGNKWNNKNARVVIDEQTGEKLLLKNNHSLFWIKMEYWGLIFFVLGIVILSQNSIVGAVVATMILLGYIFLGRKKTERDTEVKTAAMQSQAVTSNRNTNVSEENRMNIRKEKENPNRFMPN